MSRTASARGSRAASPSPAQNEPQSVMTLEDVVNAGKTPISSLPTDDSITVGGRSIMGSITSERRKPRKIDIRHSPKPEVSSPLNPERKGKEDGVEEAVKTPSQEANLRRKPRKLNRDSIEQVVVREESTGGVALNQPPSVVLDDDSNVPHQGTPQAEDSPRITELPDDGPEGYTPTRKQPRKLKRNHSSNAVPGPRPTAQVSTPVTSRVPMKTEMDALKERVRDLEGQVRDLYERPQIVTARSPRRRGKGRKASADGMMTPSEELSQLQAELVDAQNELAALKIQEGASIAGSPRLNAPSAQNFSKGPRSSRLPRTAPQTDSQPIVQNDDVEDIPRTAEPGIETGPSSSQKAVTLSGSYKIRLPNNLDMKDVKALQDGVTSATNIAKSLAATRNVSPRGAETAGDGKSWGEWFGSYSQSIARIMHNVETEAAVESTSVAPKRVQSTTSTVKRTPQRPRTVVAHNALVAKRSPVLERSRSGQSTSRVTNDLLK